MEDRTPPVTVKLPVNEKEFAGINMNPVVVLTDCRKAIKRTALETPPPSPRSPDSQKIRTEDTSRNAEAPLKMKFIKALTPLRTIPSPPELNPLKFKSLKRKRDSCDAHVEYEIEKIVGYHRDKREKMWYFIKWKGWSNEYNTFEPIENLTGCYYELMKYFDGHLVTKSEVTMKKLELHNSVKEMDLYINLKSKKLTAEDLGKFSLEFPREMKQLFQINKLDSLERRVQVQYGYIVRCLVGMAMHLDAGLVLRAQQYKLLLTLIKQRRMQLQNLQAVEKAINDREKTRIGVANEVDLDEFPDLNYIVEMKQGEGATIPKDPLLGCECLECNPRSNCCGKLGDSIFAYSPNGRLRTSSRVAIYECNSRCLCPSTCHNRVVQRGRQVKLCIFKTKSCGWGVRAEEVIPKGGFVCEYVGELIPDSEANVRDVHYQQEKKAGYMFDLDFFEDKSLELYCIDATSYGNVARFINHSCDPNLVVYPIWVDELAPNKHRLAFFARRKIRAGEEIHFDYENLENFSEEESEDNGKGYAMRMVSNVRCQCNSSNCRNWVFGNK